MADISKINVNNTTYNIKDARLPDLNSSTSQYLRGDGSWATPTISTISSSADVSDEDTFLLITPSGGGGGGNYQAKTNINPTTSSQTITPDSGYDALSSVQINAMPSGSATTPATTITANPTISVNTSTGVITATTSTTKSITPTVSAGYVSSGTAGTITVSGSNTESLSTQAATTITPTESEQTAVAANKYTTGIVKVGAISSTYVGSGITSRSSTDLTASTLTVTAPAGYYASAATKTLSDANLIAGNIKKDISIFGVTGSYEGSGGGSNWTKLATQELTANTTSTTNTSLANITLTLSDYNDKNTVLWVHIRDKAGKKNGYFYGSDTLFFHYQLANNSTSNVSTRPVTIFYVSSSGAYSETVTAYGVYAYRLYYISSNHYVQIYTRYNSSYGTINGTYVCDVYKLTMPTGMTLFA